MALLNNQEQGEAPAVDAPRTVVVYDYPQTISKYCEELWGEIGTNWDMEQWRPSTSMKLPTRVIIHTDEQELVLRLRFRTQ